MEEEANGSAEPRSTVISAVEKVEQPSFERAKSHVNFNILFFLITGALAFALYVPENSLPVSYSVVDTYNPEGNPPIFYALVALSSFFALMALFLAIASQNRISSLAKIASTLQASFWLIMAVMASLLMVYTLSFADTVYKMSQFASALGAEDEAAQAQLEVSVILIICGLILLFAIAFFVSSFRLAKESRLREEYVLLTRDCEPRRVELRWASPEQIKALFKEDVERWDLGKHQDKTVNRYGRLRSKPRLDGDRTRSYFFNGKLGAIAVVDSPHNRVFMHPRWSDEDLVRIIRKDVAETYSS